MKLLSKGDIVIVPFPFTDLTSVKLRPGVILWVETTGKNVTICFISSQNLANLAPEEFLIETGDPDFAQTGLKISSKVRVTKLVTLERGLVTRRLGELSFAQIQKLNQILIQSFQLT